MKKEERIYRNLVRPQNLLSYNVTVKETDLFIHTDIDLKQKAKDSILTYRSQIESYIEQHPEFQTTLAPWRIAGPSPEIIQKMVQAGDKANTGPMASVAGAIAQMVGLELLKYSETVIIENGGDVFVKSEQPISVGIYAGNSPLSMKIGLHIHALNHPMGVCTSSGTLGHSLSFGKADAVSVVADSCFLADAAATAIGNVVQKKQDLEIAMEFGKSIHDIRGIIIIQDEHIAMWGDLELARLNGKNG